ncbi:MAG: DUF2313 domain-containing protein [Candidatus Pacearchaeota archaeon]|jgi:uncharacterized protein YmfQ (DUF2313 family)
MEILPQQTTFIVNTDEQITQSLADYLPNDDIFRSKNIQGSNLRSLLQAFSSEFMRVEAKIKELADEHYLPYTYNLIDEWERQLGIPDECFNPKNKSIEERRQYAIAKFALMNLTSTPDFIALADFFGVRIEILNGYQHSNFFPFTFPIYFFGSIKEAKFTMIVHFLDINRPSNVFPLTFPITFGEETLANLILCIFNKLKPAPVKIVARYRDD